MGNKETMRGKRTRTESGQNGLNLLVGRRPLVREMASLAERQVQKECKMEVETRFEAGARPSSHLPKGPGIISGRR